MPQHSKILLVDDNPDKLFALSQTLEGVKNLDLITANSGLMALEKILFFDFALIITDVQMPEMDGYELAALLRGRKKTHNVPIIFVSAVYDLDMNMFEGYDSGAVDYIRTPVNTRLLINKVNTFIQLDQQKQALQDTNQQLLLAQKQQLEQHNQELQQRNLELNKIQDQLRIEKCRAEAGNHAKGLFLATMNHELRTPLNAITGYSDLMWLAVEDKQIPEECRHYLNAIQMASANLTNIITNILDISQIESEHPHLEFQAFEIIILTQEIIHLYQTNAEEKQITLEYHVAADVPMAMTSDRLRVRQILSNLVSNAIKFSHNNTVVSIIVETQDDDIAFHIEDQGIGIAKEKQQSIFNLFEQVDMSSTRKFGGLGLGLTLVKIITDLLDGHIQLKSEPDQGSVFSICLPKAPAAKLME